MLISFSYNCTSLVIYFLLFLNQNYAYSWHRCLKYKQSGCWWESHFGLEESSFTSRASIRPLSNHGSTGFRLIRTAPGCTTRHQEQQMLSQLILNFARSTWQVLSHWMNWLVATTVYSMYGRHLLCFIDLPRGQSSCPRCCTEILAHHHSLVLVTYLVSLIVFTPEWGGCHKLSLGTDALNQIKKLFASSAPLLARSLTPEASTTLIHFFITVWLDDLCSLQC